MDESQQQSARIQKMQDKTLQLVQMPVGQWTSVEISTANTVIDQWLALDDHSRQKTGRATQVFRRWLIELEEGNPLVRQPNVVDILHRILYACISVTNDQNFKNSRRLVETLERLSVKHGNKSLLPGDKAYSMLMQILAQTHGTEPETCNRAEKLLEQRLSYAGKQGCDLMMWNAVLQVLAENSPYNNEASEKAEKILRAMSVKPNEITFSMVLNSLARSKNPNAAYRAHGLLENMLENNSIKVSAWCFNVVINALSTLGTPEAAEAAEDLLWKMVQLTKEGRRECEPNTYTFCSTIHCWAKCGARFGPERAERIMRLVPELANEFGWDIKLDQHSYHATIDAWASSGLPDAVRRAEDLFYEMERAYRDGDASLHPNEYTYTTIIKAISRSGEKGAGERAENILSRMEDLAKSGNNQIRLGSICYAATINAWAKSREVGAPDRALAILRRMQKCNEKGNEDIVPSTTAYNSAIAAFANIGDSETAISLMDEMIDQTARGFKGVAPSLHTYSSVLNALAKSRVPLSAPKAMEILEKLEGLCAAGDKEMCPNQVVYSVAINCLGNSTDSDAAEQAEAIFWKMQSFYEKGHDRCRPNAHTLSAVLNTYLASTEKRKEEIPARASSIIEWAEQEAQRGNKDVLPNRICYNILVGIWAKSGLRNASAEIVSIVRKMKNHSDPRFAPDVTTYNWMMTAIVVAKHPDAAMQCHRILRNMQLLFDNGKGNQEVKPTRRCFHCVLEACLLPNQSDDSRTFILRDMAEQILNFRYWKPSSNTFVLFFRGLASISGKPDMLLPRKVMQQAINLDLVDGLVQEAFDQLESRTLSWSSKN